VRFCFAAESAEVGFVAMRYGAGEAGAAVTTNHCCGAVVVFRYGAHHFHIGLVTEGGWIHLQMIVACVEGDVSG